MTLKVTLAVPGDILRIVLACEAFVALITKAEILYGVLRTAGISTVVS